MVELMVSVVILGILAYFTAGIFKSQPVSEAGRKLSAVISEARRLAISTGTIRDDVRAATGLRARTQIEFSNEGGQSMARIWQAVEDAEPQTTFAWVQVGGTVLPRGAEIFAVGAAAATLPGGSLPPALAGPQRVNFYPDGTCDGFTVYLQKTGGTNIHERYRVFAMPLSGASGSFRDW